MSSTPEKSGANGALSWHAYGITNVGKVREYNEDSLLQRSEAGMWAVADGMGGHHAGDVASQMIVNTLDKVHEGQPLHRFIDDIENRLILVNEKLIKKADESYIPITIGSTVAIMVACGRFCVYLWAGDSRLYRQREGELRQLTTDHSQVQHYIELGLINAEDATKHPHRNIITRAVGATKKFFLDMDIQEMQKGDRYLLCSDGLTKHLADQELEDILQQGPAATERICWELIELTLLRGASDNVTAIVIDIDQ